MLFYSISQLLRHTERYWSGGWGLRYPIRLQSSPWVDSFLFVVYCMCVEPIPRCVPRFSTDELGYIEMQDAPVWRRRRRRTHLI